MKIKFFTTGGSIDKIYSIHTSTLETGEPKIGRILAEAGLNAEWDVEPILKKDSLELSDDDRRLIVERVRREPCRHIVVTHGTDTMTRTALALREVTGKVIVLTGSMRPAAFRDSDAPFNVGFAAAAVQCLPEGVYIAMNGRVFSPDAARKNHDRAMFEEITSAGRELRIAE